MGNGPGEVADTYHQALAKRIRVVNMEARRQAVGVITKVAKLTLNEGPPDPRPDSIAASIAAATGDAQGRRGW